MSASANAVSTGARLPKPQLRGHAAAFLRRHVIIAGILGLASGLAWKYAIAEPRKRAYAEFYRDYNGVADSDRIHNAGLFSYFNEVNIAEYDDL